MSNQSIATLGDLGAMNYYVTKYPNEKFRIIKDPSIATESMKNGSVKYNKPTKNPSQSIWEGFFSLTLIS